MSEQIVLIDTGSIFHPLFHVTGSDPNPDALSIAIIEKIRALASGHKHVALCLDSKKSFRKALDSSYKAARESKPAFFYHQISLALEVLAKDGFPIWEAEGFEADDLLAAGVEQAKVGHWPVLLISADKDALQLVTAHVSVKSPISGNVMTPEGVKEKFGVDPNQIQDYLAIVGDASDGVVGVKGIGAKGAAGLLQTFGNLDDLYAAIDTGSEAVKPAQLTALQAFHERLPVVRQLLALRTDAPLDFASVLKERVPADVATFGEDEIMNDIKDAMPTIEPQQQELTGDEATKSLGTFAADVARRIAPKDPTPTTPAHPPVQESVRSDVGRIVDKPALSSLPVVVDYERQLEPQSMNQAVQLAGLLFKARLFGAYGTPEAVLSTVLAGRELGISAMASLRSFHIVEGNPTMAADALRALVLKSGKAKSFRCTERTATAATFTTERQGEAPMDLRYTIEEAQAAGLVKNGSGWTKNPADMLVARASSKLARLVYPDVVAGLYAPEEF